MSRLSDREERSLAASHYAANVQSVGRNPHHLPIPNYTKMKPFIFNKIPSTFGEALALIGPVPRAGHGVHRWIFQSALKLKNGSTPAEVFEVIRIAVSDCGRTVPDREIWDAIQNSNRINLQNPGITAGDGACQPRAPKWPDVDHGAIKAIADANPGALSRLWEKARFPEWVNEDDEAFVFGLVRHLFPGDPILCLGKSIQTMACRRLSAWFGQLSTAEFIVPSPMTALTGFNQQGKPSSRCLANTGPRRFLVIEFDNGAFEAQAALHVHLSRRYPLAVVVHSGKKSLHGWYFVMGEPEERIREFMRYAVSLGADPHTWTRCQALRMPGGLRRSGSQSIRQQVQFFNPDYNQQ